MNSEAALKYLHKQKILFDFIVVVYRYLISAQYTNQYRESNLHVAKECYVSFKIGHAQVLPLQGAGEPDHRLGDGGGRRFYSDMVK